MFSQPRREKASEVAGVILGVDPRLRTCHLFRIGHKLGPFVVDVAADCTVNVNHVVLHENSCLRRRNDPAIYNSYKQRNHADRETDTGKDELE
jgi:hypothetical protein